MLKTRQWNFRDTFISNATCYTGYLLTLQYFDFWHSFGHKRPITSKSKDVTVTKGKTLPDFIMSSVFTFALVLKLSFFPQNVRYGNSVTFRNGGGGGGGP